MTSEIRQISAGFLTSLDGSVARVRHVTNKFFVYDPEASVAFRFRSFAPIFSHHHFCALSAVTLKMTTAAPQQRFRISPIPPVELIFREQIRFCHPGYPPPNTLLSLPRTDGTPSGTYGVHHRTALLACEIIANNAFGAGHLTLDQEGQQRIDTPLDGILTEGVYYFIIGEGPGMSAMNPCLSTLVNTYFLLDRYAVVPSFRDWKFPHGHIPDSWPQAISTYGEHRCGVTRFSRPLEMAHLVPKEEVDWYVRNEMEIGLGDINNNPANLLPLKVDVHKIFDARGFAIVPKIAEAETFQYVTHILSDREAEFWPTHHDILVQNLHAMSRPYLFTRFTWAILLQVKDFIIARQRRVVQLRAATDGEGFEIAEYKTEVLTAKQLLKSYGGGGSKAATKASTSGKRPANAMDDASVIDDDLVESSNDGKDMGDVWDWVDDNKRGGNRRRREWLCKGV